MITFSRDVFDAVANTRRFLQGLVWVLLWISYVSVYVHLTSKDWYFPRVDQLFNWLTILWNLGVKNNVKTFSIYHKTLFLKNLFTKNMRSSIRVSEILHCSFSRIVKWVTQSKIILNWASPMAQAVRAPWS